MNVADHLSITEKTKSVLRNALFIWGIKASLGKKDNYGRVRVRDSADRDILLLLASVSVTVIKSKKNKEQTTYLNLTPQ